MRTPFRRHPLGSMASQSHWARSVALVASVMATASAALLAAGCGHGTPALPLAASQPGTGATSLPAPTQEVRTSIATAKGSIPRYAVPGGHRTGVIPARWYGARSALPVIGRRPGWYEVRLVTRPNESTAWVRAADVTISATPYRIVVNLTTRHLLLFRFGKQLMDAPAAIGTRQDPTPTGQFFVAMFEHSPSLGYGPFIIVTSAHSNAISNWAGSGDAVIGIHGPLGAARLIGSRGAALSHGCIRIRDRYLARLGQVPAGTPITITD